MATTPHPPPKPQPAPPPKPQPAPPPRPTPPPSTPPRPPPQPPQSAPAAVKPHDAAHQPEAARRHEAPLPIGARPSDPNDPQAAKLELAERGARDRQIEPPARTIADEQRERSEEMQREGIDAWKAEHDERGPDDKPKVVPGITQRPVDESELRGNSTPAARTAQHPAAPR